MAKYDKITPEGTRDILFDECEKQNKITAMLRKIFEGGGYREVQTPGLEFFDVFQSKSEYYPQEEIYNMSDGRGRLISVRPDSTIPIARLTATKLKGAELPIRLYYSQRVYRRQQELRGRSAETLQMGVELIGVGGFESDVEILTMAAESLAKVSSGKYTIEIGHVGFYKSLMKDVAGSEDQKESIRRLIASKNYAGLNDVLDEMPSSRASDIIRGLPRLFGGEEALRAATRLVGAYNKELKSILAYLRKLLKVLAERGKGDHFVIDFGLINEADYYSSLVFRGYMQNAGMPILSGGRYDDLFADFGENLPAIGFGMNIDQLTAAALKKNSKNGKVASGLVTAGKDTIRIALTKGRLEDSFVELMKGAGYDCSELKDKGRKLLVNIPGTGIEIFLAKAPDVITYVEHGVCDIGIVGKDTILEHGGTFYEVMDLGIGKCRFALAAEKGRDFFAGIGARTVATKYPAVTSRYFESKGMDVDVIKIEGSVEIAPLLSLADGIVDIVETGTTLKENGLEVIEFFRNISARMLVNVSSMKMKKVAIDSFATKIAKQVALKK
jgi:ATP phosphoribosyltransferase regulatory subunit